MSNREDWLLLFIGLPGGEFPTDQIRVMKGLFLFSQKATGDIRNLYDFQPYYYGPFDTRVYDDLEALQSEGMIRCEPVLGANQTIYSLTGKGEERCVQLKRQVDPAQLKLLVQVKELVTSLNFLALLRSVYEEYPQFSTSSVMRL